MSHEKKQEVLKLLQNKEAIPDFEKFNEAYRFYKLHPAKNKSQEAIYNRKGFTDQGLKNLLYDLQKMYGITDVEIIETLNCENQVAPLSFIEKFIHGFEALEQNLKSDALVLMKFANEFGEDIIFATPVLSDYFKNDYERLLSLVPENADSQNELKIDKLVSYFEKEIKGVVFPKELESILDENKEIIPINPIDLNDVKKDFIEDLKIPEFAFLNQVPGEEIKALTKEESVSLRDEFPFLNDPNCPELLFIVVGKRIATWNIYLKLHAELQEINEGKKEVSQDDKLLITSNCEKAFNENRQLWDELKYFGETGEILGKHPIFRESVAKREVDGMTNEELFKFKNASATYLSRKRKELLKNTKDAAKTEQLNADISDREYMLSLVNAKIGVPNAGAQTK